MTKTGNSKRPTKAASKQPNTKEICFYRSNEKPYGVFSNLHRMPVFFEGREFPTAEHAYQAGKTAKKAVREWVLSAPTPSLVAMAAHGLYSWDIIPSWSKIKFSRMRDVLRAKFAQHEDLRALLLATGQKRLVERGTTNSAVNRLWGEVNGKGKNMLGILLMEVRDELRKKEVSQLVAITRPRRKIPARTSQRNAVTAAA